MAVWMLGIAAWLALTVLFLIWHHARVQARSGLSFSAALEAIEMESLKRHVPASEAGKTVPMGIIFYNNFVRAGYRIADNSTPTVEEIINIIREDMEGRMEMRFINGHLHSCQRDGVFVHLPLEDADAGIAQSILRKLRLMYAGRA